MKMIRPRESSRLLHVGIMASRSHRPGYGGGVNIYTRALVEALAHNTPSSYRYSILINETDVPVYGRGNKWPSNINIVGLKDFEPQQNLATRLYRRAKRLLGRKVPSHYGDPYVVRQIAELSLDLLHYPATLIYPLEVTPPCVLTVFDLQHEYYPEFFTNAELEWRRQWYLPSAMKAKHIVAPSTYTKHTLQEKYGLAPEKISVIPVGIDPDLVPAHPQEIERVREKYCLPSSYIYYPANPWPHKNHARLMAALRAYSERHGESPMLVLSGRLLDERRDAMQLAIAAGVANKVFDIGFVPPEDMAGLYGGAMMMIFPSLFEGFGIPLIEAMAYGCPIAAADSTSIPECVGDAAILFNPLSVVGMAQAIATLKENPALRASLSERGRHRVARFFWPSIVTEIVGLYTDIFRRVMSA